MGIHGLAKLIADQSPGAIKEQDIKNYFGKYVFLFHDDATGVKWVNDSGYSTDEEWVRIDCHYLHE